MGNSNERANSQNWKPAHPNEGDDERWKDSPSTETTGAEGENAKKDGTFRRDQNTPDSQGRDATEVSKNKKERSQSPA
jgi:hypothetical protein